MEEWRDIKEIYNGFYQVSNYGRVRSTDRAVKQRGDMIQIKKGKILSPTINRYGYCICALSINNKLRTHHIHRLVALTWLDPPTEGNHEVNHIDGNKQNNNAANLEWSNRSANINHAIRTGLLKFKFGECRYNSKVSDLDRIKIMESRIKGVTLLELSKQYGVSIATISKIHHTQIKLRQGNDNT